MGMYMRAIRVSDMVGSGTVAGAVYLLLSSPCASCPLSPACRLTLRLPCLPRNCQPPTVTTVPGQPQRRTRQALQAQLRPSQHGGRCGSERCLGLGVGEWVQTSNGSRLNRVTGRRGISLGFGAAAHSFRRSSPPSAVCALTCVEAHSSPPGVAFHFSLLQQLPFLSACA